MMKKTRLFLYFAILIAASSALLGCITPRSVEVSIVDAEGNFVQGAEINLVSGYRSLNFDVSGKSGPGKYNRVTDKIGITNELGRYNFIGLMAEDVSIVVRKEGFYQTRAYLKDGNEIVIPLRKKMAPTTLLKKKIFKSLPDGNGVFGFDVIKGDLVSPHGKGKYRDFDLHVSTHVKMWGDKAYKVQRGEIKTSGKDNGFVAHYSHGQTNPISDFSGPYLAPRSGYVASIEEAKKVAPRLSDGAPKTWYWTDAFEIRRPDIVYESFFFKVRSNSQDGPIYGKIISQIGFDNGNGDSPRVSFSYLVNFNGTRSLESDEIISYLP